MKCKILSGDGWQAVEKAVNAWLARQPSATKVHLSETKMHTTKVGTKTIGVATVTVWYD
jgi:hypothetical protein